ncbi:hypothetical protein GN956_G16104 [Arapaima gigas]
MRSVNVDMVAWVLHHGLRGNISSNLVICSVLVVQLLGSMLKNSITCHRWRIFNQPLIGQKEAGGGNTHFHNLMRRSPGIA